VIQNFFSVYKDLESKWSRVGDVMGREAGNAELVKAINMYHDNEKHDAPSLEFLKTPDYWHASIQPSDIPKQVAGRPVLSYPYKVSAYIVVPSRCNNKYEFDHKSGMVELDRVLYAATFYPFEYGFIPQTLYEDGDPLDVLVIASYPLNVGSMADVRILGMLEMEDEKGPAVKILAVVDNDPRFMEIEDLSHVGKHVLTEVKHFFETYKMLEPNKWSRVKVWKGREDAVEEIRRTNVAYLAKAKRPLENVPRFDRMEIGSGYPSSVNAIVTCPKGTSNIYFYDKDLGLLRLNRRLHSSMYYPFNLGIIPQTFGEGKPIKIIIISIFDLAPGCLVKCRVIGKLELEEEVGPDSRIIAVPEYEPRLTEVTDIDHLRKHVKDEIFNFYQNYKMLEDRQSWTKVKNWKDKESAERFIIRAHERYYLYGLRMEEMERQLVEETNLRQGLEARLEALERKCSTLMLQSEAQHPTSTSQSLDS
jgi:inorganic pyrophosphatase